ARRWLSSDSLSGPAPFAKFSVHTDCPKRPGEYSRRALNFSRYDLLRSRVLYLFFYCLVGATLGIFESRWQGSPWPLASLQPRLLSASSSDPNVTIVLRSQLWRAAVTIAMTSACVKG